MQRARLPRRKFFRVRRAEPGEGCSRGARLAAFLILCASFAAGAEPTSDAPHRDPLTLIEQVKRLVPEEAAATRPVRVRGVVTLSFGGRSGLYLQDETGGVFVAQRTSRGPVLRTGDWVECHGWTAAGRYAPIIELDRIVVLGRRDLPQPIRLSLGEFPSGRHDAEWVEVRGVVRRALPMPDGRAELLLAVGRERLRIVVVDMLGRPALSLVDAVVRLSGVAGGHFSPNRQLMAATLFVPNPRFLAVERAPPPDPFALEQRLSTSLFAYAPDARWEHRCRVRGVVTHALPGKGIFLRDDSGPLYAELVGQPAPHPGEIVDVVGFPAVETGVAYLQESQVRLVSVGDRPQAREVTMADLIAGQIRTGELIAAEGRLLEASRLRDRWLLTVGSDGRTFEAEVGNLDGGHALPVLGSRLRVQGILWPEAADARGSLVGTQTLRVLVPSPGEITVRERPSWWTQGRLAGAALALTLLVAVAAAWIWLLRRRVAAQAAVIAEKAVGKAVAEERARAACELHDTLAQGLAGLGFELEALAGDLAEAAPRVRQHLERARRMVRHNHDDVRQSLAHLRALPPVKIRLPDALRATFEHRASAAAGVEFRFLSRGQPYDLPATAEHNVTRIGQEAVTNALKHGQPRRVEVELHYEPGAVELRVRDDGCGFAAGGASMREHFGLRVMHERARRIGGALEVRSEPGRGTSVLLHVPRPEVHEESAS